MPDEKIFHKFFEVFNNRDIKEMGSLLNPAAELFFPKTDPLVGKEHVLKFVHILLRRYPELSFKIKRVIQQGDRAAVHWTNRGRNRRNEPYQNEGVTILEMKDGKISFISDFFKNTEAF